MAAGQKVIKKNQSLIPFFGERMSFIRGLDPLGLQNTSDATFSRLLPGLNNVTGRIHYYSFYCWLLDEYSKQIGNTAPEDQRKFIRTAEYIIALSSQFYDGDNSSIPGSNYAKEQVQNEEIQMHELTSGISNQDGTTSNTYWKFKLGAFGQYYLGSLRDIGIIINREKDGQIYTRTNSRNGEFVSGEMLAQAFDQNIPPEKKKLFFNCMSNGWISEDQLKELLPEFNLTQVAEGSENQELLTKLLIQKDYPLRVEEKPATLRKETIYHLLKFVASEPDQFDERKFVYSAYNRKGLVEGKRAPSLFGWYYYQFNEFWHYANTSIFNGTLDYLEGTYGPNWVQLHRFVDEVTDLVVEKFTSEGLATSAEAQISQVLSKLKPHEYHYLKEASLNSKEERIFYGFLLIFSEYLNNKGDLAILKEYGEIYELPKDGEGVGYFLQQFKVKLETPLVQFLKEYIFKKIIYRHQYVAFRKIRGGGLSTQKFIIEDYHIRYLGNFEANFTGPRIGSLISFLKDLKIISPDNKLTDYGNHVLGQIAPTDD